MATGLVHVTQAMNYIGSLQAGGSPSTSEQTTYLAYLNTFLGRLQQLEYNGFTETITVSGRQRVVAVDTAGVWTNTETGGTETRTRTPTTVTTYASIGTDNTYPKGWDEAIQYNLAVQMMGSQGTDQQTAARITAMAQSSLEAIAPKDTGKPTAQEKAA